MCNDGVMAEMRLWIRSNWNNVMKGWILVH